MIISAEKRMTPLESYFNYYDRTTHTATKNLSIFYVIMHFLLINHQYTESNAIKGKQKKVI